MKRSILCLAIAFAATAGANELDRDMAKAPAIITALPQTTVIRVNNQTKEVEVVHLTAKLNKGQKVEGAKFEKVAVNTEIAGIKFDASNELDATSSTSSWRSGGWAVAGRGPRGNAYVAGGRYGGGYGYRGGYAGYGYNNGYYGNTGYYNQPYYGYGNYNTGYSYNPYYYNNSYYSVNNGCYGNVEMNVGGYYGGCNNNYYASYRVAGYAYVAQPYYYYATPQYSYYYCGNGMLY
jgi:hypothetical protein